MTIERINDLPQMTDILERMRTYQQQRRTDLKRNYDIPPCGREKCAILFNEAMAEIERLRAELEKAHRLIGQSIGWQRDAEITKAKQQAEIERLRGQG